MSIDKTRDNIGSKNLDDHARKELLDKFVQAGGEVINEREERRKRALSIDREQQKSMLQKQEQRKKDRQQEQKSKTGANSSSIAAKNSSSAGKATQGSMWERLRISFLCWIKGGCILTGDSLSPKFIKDFEGEFNNIISNLNLLYIELIQGNPQHAETIIEYLDSHNPIYFELLEKAGQIYDKHELTPFMETAHRYGSQPIPIHRLEQYILALFTKLYILYNHISQLNSAIELATKKMAELDPKRQSMFNKRRKKALSDVQTLYLNFFPTFYYIVLKIKKRMIPLSGEAMTSALAIPLDQFPGQRGGIPDPANDKESSSENKDEANKKENGQQEGEEQDEQQDEQDEKQSKDKDKQEKIKEEDLPKPVGIGLKMMRPLKIDNLRKKVDSKSYYYNDLADNDKAFLSYLLYKEFDREYTFVLTTNKIKLAADYSGGTKTDYRQMLNDLFQISHDVEDEFASYTKAAEELKEHRSNKPSQAGYIQHSKRTTELENRRLQSARALRNTLKDMMEKVAETLEVLIKDCRKEGKIVENPKEIIQFEEGIEGKRKLNGQSVLNVLQYTYAYARAFAFRLSDQGGDLYGGILEMDEDIFGNPMGSSMEPEGNESTAHSEEESSAKEEQEQSSQNSESNNQQNSNSFSDKEDSHLNKRLESGTTHEELDNLGF